MGVPCCPSYQLETDDSCQKKDDDMSKRLAVGLVVVALVAVVASVAWTQGGWGCGACPRWQTMGPADQQQATGLHQQIRQAQWELYGLQQQGADPAVVAQKQKAIAEFRDNLNKVMAATQPTNCPWYGQAGTAPRRGTGSAAGRGCWGCGMGGGRSGGNCPWYGQAGTAPRAGTGPAAGRGGWGCGMGGGRWGGNCPWVPSSNTQ